MSCSVVVSYAPVISGGSMSSDPQLISAITQSVEYYTSTESLEILHGPNYQNSEKLINESNINKIRSGQPIVFRDSIWPKYTILDYTFTTILESKDDILTFFKATLGQEMRCNDYMGRIWLGILNNPESPITQVSRYYIEVNIVFEGVLESW